MLYLNGMYLRVTFILCRNPLWWQTLTFLFSITECANGEVRLISGPGEERGVAPTEGTVEVCLDQRWVAVCDQGWDQRAANVTCRQLGLTSGDP